MKPKAQVVGVLAAASLVLSACGPQADAGDPDYPTGDIEMLVGFAPGGQNDVTARHFAEQLENELGQTVLVVNREGGGGSIAAAEAHGAAADGYTLLFAPTGAFTAGVLLQDVPYEIADFRSIVPVSENTFIVTVSADSELEQFEDLQNLEGRVTYSAFGEGHATHLIGAGVAQYFDLDAAVATYPGGAPALQPIINGEVDFGIQDISSALPRIESGELVPLAVSTDYVPDELAELADDIPSISEFDLDDYIFAGSQALVVPADTPDEIVETLTEAASAVIESEEHQTFVAENGGVVPDVGGEEWFGEFMPAELNQFETLYNKHGVEY